MTQTAFKNRNYGLKILTKKTNLKKTQLSNTMWDRFS